MSTSIDTFIGELEQRLKDARLVQEKFPDAKIDRLPDGRQVYLSKSALEVADRVEFIREDSFPSAVTYIQLQDGFPALRVYADHDHLHDIAPSLLERLRKDSPEAYAVLVRLAKTR